MTCQALRGELYQCGLNPKGNKSIYYFYKTVSCHSYPMVVRSALASKTSNMTVRTLLASPGARPEQMSPRPGQVTRAQWTSALSYGTRYSRLFRPLLLRVLYVAHHARPRQCNCCRRYASPRPRLLQPARSATCTSCAQGCARMYLARGVRRYFKFVY